MHDTSTSDAYIIHGAIVILLSSTYFITKDMATPQVVPPPKMPHLMTKVYEEIQAHPRFPETNKSFKFQFDVVVSGLSWATKENNAWCRRVWKHLYLGEPMLKEEEMFDTAQ
jgi:hypothetical protein